MKMVVVVVSLIQIMSGKTVKDWEVVVVVNIFEHKIVVVEE